MTNKEEKRETKGNRGGIESRGKRVQEE